MRVATLGIGLASAACQLGTPAPAQSPPASVHPASTRGAAPTLPRYFPRAPARLTVVGTSERGVLATHQAMRLLLRADQGLPDSAPFLVAASAAGAETGGSPTATPATSTLMLPARLGGGFLFVVGRELWHAPSWLERPRRLFEFAAAPRVHLGIDSLVAQEAGRSAFAFDVTGTLLPLAHWPESPAIADLAARDGKHAAVVADLRGLAVTEDGGTTWREIPTARTPFGVRVAAGGYVVRGRNGGDEREISWRVDTHGDMRSELGAPSESDADEAKRPSNQRALSSAAWERVITRGYEDSARDRFVVLDHGVLEIYRKSDGALLAQRAAGDARATCQPIHWPSTKPGADPGFACLGPDGTSLWRVGEHDATRVMQLPGQRRVWSSEVGTLALEGACENASLSAGTTTLCVWGRGGNIPTTVRLQGSGPSDILLPLRDGSVVVVRPPAGPRLARRAAEMFVDVAPKANGAAPGDVAPKANVRGVPLRTGTVPAEVAAMLAEGHWLGHVEALDQGDIALWVEHESRLLGVRVHPDGRIDVGPRSAVASMHRTAGLRSLSWSVGGASFESTDGGLRYTQIGLPATDAVQAPAASGRSSAPPPPTSSSKPGPTFTEAGCTAIGCILPTLLRVGWGAEEARSSAPLAAQRSPAVASSPARIALDCALVSRSNDEPKPAPVSRRVQTSVLAGPRIPPPFYRGPPSGGGGPFYGTPSPKVRPDQLLQGWDTLDIADRRSATFLGRVYLWGAFTLGADPASGWQWRWYDAKTHSVHASAIAKPPDVVTRQHQMQTSTMSRVSWAVVASSDPRRAVGFHSDATRSLVFSLVEGEAPTAIELDDGTDFGVLEAGIAAPGDRTILAGAVGDPAGTAIYLARGARAARIARIPRIGVQGKPSAALVALHTDGVRIAIAVEDRDVASRTEAAFYVREVYPSVGAVRRYGTTRTLSVCSPNSLGFEAWTKLELSSDLTLQGLAHTAHLQSPTRARLRFGDDGSVCIAEATSAVESDAAAALMKMPLRSAPPESVPLTVGHGSRHYTLACGVPHNTK